MGLDYQIVFVNFCKEIKIEKKRGEKGEKNCI
jgi:hypothetical protein